MVLGLDKLRRQATISPWMGAANSELTPKLSQATVDLKFEKEASKILRSQVQKAEKVSYGLKGQLKEAEFEARVAAQAAKTTDEKAKIYKAMLKPTSG